MADVQELVRGYVLMDAKVPVLLLVDILVLRLVTGHVERHVMQQANATTAQRFAKVAVQVVVVVHVSQAHRVGILQHLDGKF